MVTKGWNVSDLFRLLNEGNLECESKKLKESWGDYDRLFNELIEKLSLEMVLCEVEFKVNGEGLLPFK